jgi:hypothetical protein
MINGINLPAKHNPRWPDGNASETIKFLTGAAPGLPAPRRKTVRFPEIAGRLSGTLRRIGAKLFAANDAEARWRGWQITELRAGLARSYRDERFDALQALRDAAAQLAVQPEDRGGPLS